MELPYPELWLLELGVTKIAAWIPAVWLLDSKEEREAGFSDFWNFPPNGMTESGLAHLLVEMHRRGLFEIGRCVDGEPAGTVVPKDGVELHDYLTDELQRAVGKTYPFSVGRFHYVRATAAGIARWEEYAEPDWSRYRGEFAGRLERAGETVWSQSAMTEAFARELLDVFGGDAYLPATIHWETARTITHEPWSPFWGKTLPAGVTVSVDVTEFGPRPIDCDDHELNAQWDDYQQRFSEICKWYERDVWSHPDRPVPVATP